MTRLTTPYVAERHRYRLGVYYSGGAAPSFRKQVYETVAMRMNVHLRCMRVKNAQVLIRSDKSAVESG
ncbi:MAG: hypothetical protein ACI3Z5_03535 [Paludibacteraceae bacterium]